VLRHSYKSIHPASRSLLGTTTLLAESCRKHQIGVHPERANVCPESRRFLTYRKAVSAHRKAESKSLVWPGKQVVNLIADGAPPHSLGAFIPQQCAPHSLAPEVFRPIIRLFCRTCMFPGAHQGEKHSQTCHTCQTSRHLFCSCSRIGCSAGSTQTLPAHRGSICPSTHARQSCTGLLFFRSTPHYLLV
jgi:hypothetical protein